MEVKDGAQVRRWRKKARYSQRELGFLVRRTHTTIYKIEAGILTNISEDLALDIANRLEVPWEDLFIAREVTANPEVATVTDDKMPIPA
ncbi:MAG: helix-turn-helix transcriptional regulator [Gordonia sp. (in: high G+C Gram-positive bacteria)]|uniref:helix-turn-helix transcriptional regulator n=1 Tax=Gordonia sp. (in: high G+C Gram-positive bacteria) TaxID=84139 RepID=UPI003C748E36